MPPPMSANALKRLGERFAAGTATAEDGELLNEYIASCDEPMSRASDIVASAGFAPTSRLKTRGTLVEKLQRDPNTKLPSVQDVAGLRVTVTGTLLDQDAAVAAIVAAFEAAGCTTRVRDRREEPSFGYRAVHVIATVDRTKVEIQVRTQLQDLWAQVAEKMGDVFGRQVRYGGNPDSRGENELDKGIRILVNNHRGEVSELVAGIERNQAQVLNFPEYDDEEYRELLSVTRAEVTQNVQDVAQGMATQIQFLERIK